MAVAREEVCLRKLREISPDARRDGIDARHECRLLFGIENAHLDQGLEQLNRYEARPRETGERQRAVSLAVRERSISFGSRGDPCCSRKCLPLKMIPASRLVVRT